MIYWPGTNIVKSNNNAFTLWKENKPSFANNTKWRQSLLGQRNAAHSKKNQITISHKK